MFKHTILKNNNCENIFYSSYCVFHLKEKPKAHSLTPHIKQEGCGSFGMGIEQIDKHNHITTTHDFY